MEDKEMKLEDVKTPHTLGKSITQPLKKKTSA